MELSPPLPIRPSRRLLALLVLVTASVVWAPPPAFACSCVMDSLPAHLDRADVVVRGTVESRDELGDPLRVVSSSADEVVYRVAVDEVYKGESGTVLEVHSVASGASCGLEVEVGRRYLLFVERQEGELWGNLCGGTRPAGPAATEELRRATAVTGAGGPHPPDGSVPVPEQRDGSMLPWTVPGLALAALAAAAYLRRRRTA